MQKDFAKDFTSKDTAHICGPVGVTVFDNPYTQKQDAPDLIVAVNVPPKKTDQKIKQMVIDALTMLVLPPSINEIIICSHGDNINPDIVCDQETPWSEPIHIDIPEVITPIPVNNYNPTHNQQIIYRNNAFENLLNQQFLHQKNKYDNTIFFYPNIKNK